MHLNAKRNEYADLLDHAAEIMEAKAFVSQVAQVWTEMQARGEG